MLYEVITVLGGVEEAREEAFYNFGMDLGIAFQYMDDASYNFV